MNEAPLELTTDQMTVTITTDEKPVMSADNELLVEISKRLDVLTKGVMALNSNARMYVRELSLDGASMRVVAETRDLDKPPRKVQLSYPIGNSYNDPDRVFNSLARTVLVSLNILALHADVEALAGIMSAGKQEVLFN